MDNISWESFFGLVYGGGNDVRSGHRSPLVKYTTSPHISFTRHGSRANLSVTSINLEGLKISKYISGIELGEAVTFVGVVSGEC